MVLLMPCNRLDEKLKALTKRKATLQKEGKEKLVKMDSVKSQIDQLMKVMYIATRARITDLNFACCRLHQIFRRKCTKSFRVYLLQTKNPAADIRP